MGRNIWIQRLSEYNIYAPGGVPITYKSDEKGELVANYKIQDYLGNVRAVINQDKQITGMYDYMPFGEQVTVSPSRTKDRLSFIGKEQDKESSLHDLGVRKYDNGIGRFLSIDPLWEKYLAWSPYHYCGNNPINASDPSGLKPGDLFKSMDLAAKDFGVCYNSKSIKSNKEMAVAIYSITKDGDEYFSYTKPVVGTKNGVKPTKADKNVPKGSDIGAYAHTHGAYLKEYDLEKPNTTILRNGNNNPSTGDWMFLDSHKPNIFYTITPNGSLFKMNKTERSEELLDTTLPNDKKDPTSKQNAELNIQLENN